MRYIILLLSLSVVQFVSCAMTGGRQAYDLTDPEQLKTVEKFAKYGVDAIATRRMNEAKLSQGVSSSDEKVLSYNHRVLSAQRQVVAGVNYFMKIKMNDATCRQFCAVEECDLVVWERSWDNFTNLTKFDCNLNTPKSSSSMILGSPFKNKNVLIGQPKVVELDTKSQTALDAIVTGINGKLNSSYLHKIKSVSEVKKQMVAGILYKFKFMIVKTVCDKQKSGDLEAECEIFEGAKDMECNGSILDKVWAINRYSSVKFDCN